MGKSLKGKEIGKDPCQRKAGKWITMFISDVSLVGAVKQFEQNTNLAS